MTELGVWHNCESVPIVPKPWRCVLQIALVVCQVIAGLAALYGLYFVIMALPLSPLPPGPKPVTDTVNRFAILVFAKDEAAVIGRLVDTLQQQNYPADAFDVFVTADNCTDDTARIAAAHGAIVWERHDLERIGKGFALNWFFARFGDECASEYDACAIFDADNVVDPGFLAAMNRQLNLGTEVVTGYRMGKNPTSSVVAGMSTLFWLLQTRLFFVGRVRRGLPCPTVGGTGYVFTLSALPQERWETHSVCEDIEFTLQSIAAGHKVSLAYDAVFYDEQPITWAQSLKQRYRWSLGALQNIRLCTPNLLRALPARGRTTFDALLYSVGSFVSGLSTIVSLLTTVLFAAVTGLWAATAAGAAISLVVGYAVIAAIAWLVLALEKVSWRGAWKSVALFPLFLVSWALLYVVILFYRNTTWVTIPHAESMSLDDAVAQVNTANTANTAAGWDDASEGRAPAIADNTSPLPEQG